MDPVDKWMLARNMDFPGADEYADIIRRRIPPQLIPPREGDKPQPQMPPPPQVQLAQAKMQIEGIKGKREEIKLRIDLLKLLHEARDDKTEIRTEVLNTLAELHNPQPQEQTAGRGQQLS
jgi:hypothetical protein